MSVKPGAPGSASNHAAVVEPQQLLQDFITTAGGAKRQRLGSMPLATTSDGSSPSQPAKSSTGALQVDIKGGRASSAAVPLATEQARAQAGTSGTPAQTGRDCNKENHAHVSTLDVVHEGQPGSACSKPALSPAGDIITLSDSDDGDDNDQSGGGSEETQLKMKCEPTEYEETSSTLSKRDRKLRQIRLRQNELRIEEAKLLLLQRLRNSQQDQFKSQDAGSKAQAAAKPATTVGPANGAAVLTVPSRPMPGVKSAAYTSMLTSNAGLKQLPSKEASTPMASMHSGQARPAVSSALKMDGGGIRPGLSVPAHGAAAYSRQLPVTGQATSMLSRPSLNQPAVASAQGSLINGAYRPNALQAATATPQRLDHSAGLQRTPAAQNGSSGGTPGSAGRPQPSTAAAMLSAARSAGSGAVASAYTPGRAPTQHDAATAAMLAAERQRTARLAHRKHLERIMAQIQPPRPTLRRMDFVPFLPMDSSDGFVYLLGLEEVVKYLTRKGGKDDAGLDVPKHLACAKCKVDYSPSWRCDRLAAGGSGDVVCERCLVSRQKQAVRRDYATKLDRVLEEVSLRDRELEIQLLAAANSVGGGGLAAATPVVPASTAAMSSAARSSSGGSGRRPEASEHALLTAAAGKSTPRGAAAAAPLPHAQSAAAAAAAVSAQVALSYQNAYDGIMNRVKKQFANADMQLHYLPGVVPMVRQGKHDAIH